MLIDDVSAKCKVLGYSPKTFKTYWHHIESFLRHERNLRGEWVHPTKLGREEIERFLTHLAVKQHVSPNTQNLALQGILFLYRHVLRIDIQGVNALRAKKPLFIPVVLSVDEVRAGLGYGCGMRIGEIFSLRIKDVDFGNRLIHVRQAKGAKDRTVQLPEALIAPLKQQIAETERLHAIDMKEGCARVPIPFALERRSPRLPQDIGWW
jgi:integrase